MHQYLYTTCVKDHREACVLEVKNGMLLCQSCLKVVRLFTYTQQLPQVEIVLGHNVGMWDLYSFPIQITVTVSENYMRPICVKRRRLR